MISPRSNEKIRKRMIALKIPSYRELAKMTGYSNTLISHIASGQNRVTDKQAACIADILDCEPEDIFAQDDFLNPDTPLLK